MVSDQNAPLSQAEMYLARVLFVNRVLSSRGQAYEDLFTSVMHRAVEGFRPIKPQGNLGDRKNDGYVRDAGRYWQVYAPGDPRASINTAITKLETDFCGLKEYWDSFAPVREYFFAFNDKYDGAYASMEAALAQIKKQHGLVESAPFLAKDLEDRFLSMPRSGVMAIVGLIPDPVGLESLHYDALSEILVYLTRQRQPISLQSTLVAPDFNEKIRFNDIGPTVGGLLSTGSWQNRVVDEYFRKNSTFTRRGVRDRLAIAYAAAKTQDESVPEGVYPGDLIFFRLLGGLMPVDNPHIQDAAIALVAYFFESCDVFEEPTGGRSHAAP